MSDEVEIKSEYRSIKNIYLNLVWHSRFTIGITILVFIIYFLSNEILVFGLLTVYGLLVFILGYMSDYEDDGLQEYYINHPDEVVIKGEFLTDSLFMNIKGILVFIIGIAMMMNLG